MADPQTPDDAVTETEATTTDAASTEAGAPDPVDAVESVGNAAEQVADAAASSFVPPSFDGAGAGGDAAELSMLEAPKRDVLDALQSTRTEGGKRGSAGVLAEILPKRLADACGADVPGPLAAASNKAFAPVGGSSAPLARAAGRNRRLPNRGSDPGRRRRQ